jgi:hypothetical protein
MACRSDVDMLCGSVALSYSCGCFDGGAPGTAAPAHTRWLLGLLPVLRAPLLPMRSRLGRDCSPAEPGPTGPCPLVVSCCSTPCRFCEAGCFWLGAPNAGIGGRSAELTPRAVGASPSPTALAKSHIAPDAAVYMLSARDQARCVRSFSLNFLLWRRGRVGRGSVLAMKSFAVCFAPLCALRIAGELVSAACMQTLYDI